MNRFGRWLLVGCLSFTSVGAAQGFFDVPELHWAEDAVGIVSDLGVVIGFPDGSYRGNDAVTRYQAALMFVRFLAALENEVGSALLPMTEVLNELVTDLGFLSARVDEVVASGGAAGVITALGEEVRLARGEAAAARERVEALEGMFVTAVDDGLLGEEARRLVLEFDERMRTLRDLEGELAAVMMTANEALTVGAVNADELRFLVEAVERLFGSLGEQGVVIEGLEGALGGLSGSVGRLDGLVSQQGGLLGELGEIVAGVRAEQGGLRERVSAVEVRLGALGERVTRLEERRFGGSVSVGFGVGDECGVVCRSYFGDVVEVDGLRLGVSLRGGGDAGGVEAFGVDGVLRAGGAGARFDLGAIEVDSLSAFLKPRGSGEVSVSVGDVTVGSVGVSFPLGVVGDASVVARAGFPESWDVVRPSLVFVADASGERRLVLLSVEPRVGEFFARVTGALGEGQHESLPYSVNTWAVAASLGWGEAFVVDGEFSSAGFVGDLGEVPSDASAFVVRGRLLSGVIPGVSHLDVGYRSVPAGWGSVWVSGDAVGGFDADQVGVWGEVGLGLGPVSAGAFVDSFRVADGSSVVAFGAAADAVVWRGVGALVSAEVVSVGGVSLGESGELGRSRDRAAVEDAVVLSDSLVGFLRDAGGARADGDYASVVSVAVGHDGGVEGALVPGLSVGVRYRLVGPNLGGRELWSAAEYDLTLPWVRVRPEVAFGTVDRSGVVREQFMEWVVGGSVESVGLAFGDVRPVVGGDVRFRSVTRGSEDAEGSGGFSELRWGVGFELEDVLFESARLSVRYGESSRSLVLPGLSLGGSSYEALFGNSSGSLVSHNHRGLQLDWVSSDFTVGYGVFSNELGSLVGGDQRLSVGYNVKF